MHRRAQAVYAESGFLHLCLCLASCSEFWSCSESDEQEKIREFWKEGIQSVQLLILVVFSGKWLKSSGPLSRTLTDITCPPAPGSWLLVLDLLLLLLLLLVLDLLLLLLVLDLL